MTGINNVIRLKFGHCNTLGQQRRNLVNAGWEFELDCRMPRLVASCFGGQSRWTTRHGHALRRRTDRVGRNVRRNPPDTAGRLNLIESSWLRPLAGQQGVWLNSDIRNTTAILERLQAGDDTAASQLLPIVYQELRALAGHLFQNEPSNHTLQPTAIVHEAYLRLISVPDGTWTGRAHFLAVAAKAMRQILIDHARRRNAAKRGGHGWNRITLDRALDAMESNTIDATDLDEALGRLAQRSERQAQIVELRVFGGLTVDEVAEVTGLGRTTINAEWTIAKAWLKRELLGNRPQ